MSRFTTLALGFGALLAMGLANAPVHADASLSDTGTIVVAETKGMDNRDGRRGGRQDDRGDRQDDRSGDRDTRQDCRQDEGAVGGDKRDCKQEGRQDSSESATTN